MKIKQSLKDKRKIEHFVLENEMKVILIQDIESDKSSVALSVNVGSINDYKEVEGIAHFLEHMMYLGSEKYKGQHTFSDFLTNNGSEMDNAYTCDNNTVFYYDIPNNHLQKSLDMFGALFEKPLLSEDGVEHEKNAVQSEYTQSLQNDGFRIEELMKHLSDRDHPYSQFTMGSLKSFNHDNLYKLVQKFHDQYYSANLMSLMVYSNKEIEETKVMVQQYFSRIENKNIKLQKYQNPYQQQHLNKFIRMQPIKDKDTIQIVWNIENLLDNYHKSCGLILSSIFGLENKNSLYQMLLDDQMIIKLSAGFTDRIYTFTEFYIKIQLTQKGLQNYQKVIEGVFSYLQMLQKHKINGEQIQQIQQMQQIEFDYQCKQWPIDFVLELSDNVIQYNIEDIICGDKLVHEIDIDYVNNVLNQLQLENMNILLISKQNKVEDLDLYYEEYQVKYSIQDFSSELIQLYNNPDYFSSKNKSIGICGNNEFIIQEVQQLENHDMNGQIELVFENDGHRIWFKQDNQFDCSVINSQLLIYFESDIQNIEQMVGRTIYFEMFKTLVNEELYDADQVGYKISLQMEQQSIRFNIQGFNQHFNRIWKYLFNKIFQLKQMLLDDHEYVSTSFESMRQKIQTDMSNVVKGQPHELAQSILRYLVIKGGDHCFMLKLEIIKNYSYTMFIDSCKQFLNKVHIDWLVLGNINRQLTLELKDEIKCILNHNQIQQLELSEVQHKQVIRLDDSYGYEFDLMDRLQNENLNSCYTLYIQSELRENNRNRVLFEFLSQFLSQWFFDSLRTEQQLGYNCFSFYQQFRGRCGYVFLIQSDVQNSNYLKERVDEFIKDSYDNICEMEEDEFIEIKEGVQSILTQNHNNIREEATVEFNEINKREYLFNRKVNDSQLVQNVNIDDIIRLYEQNILKNTNRLELHLVSDVHKQKYSQSRNHNDIKIQNIKEFKQKLEFYEDCYHPTKNHSQ